jgi:shikimate 5-dehydrogenase
VNTLYRGAKGWQAASTDGDGWIRGLARIDCKIEQFKKIVVMGAGGAVASILRAIPQGPDLVVLERSKGSLTPQRLAAELKGRGDDTLLLQGTSAPHQGDDLAAFTPALDDFMGVVCDIVYGKPSALYFRAIALDLTAQDGEAMLIEQARLSQKLWWGKAAAYEDMAAALRGKV